MRIDTKLGQALRAAWSIPFKMERFSKLELEEILEKSVALARKRYSKDDPQDRDLEKLINDEIIGRMSEGAAYHLAVTAGLVCEHNDEEVSRQFYYDLKISLPDLSESCRVEVKWIPYDPGRTFPSWSRSSKIATSIREYREYDFMLIMTARDNDDVIYPIWFFDNETWNSKNGFFDDSQYNEDGLFIKHGHAANLGFLTRLCRVGA